jgi:hypothetical protein
MTRKRIRVAYYAARAATIDCARSFDDVASLPGIDCASLEGAWAVIRVIRIATDPYLV